MSNRYTLDSVVHGRSLRRFPPRIAEQILRALNSDFDWHVTGVDFGKNPTEEDVVLHFCDKQFGGATFFAEEETHQSGLTTK